jgi:hypothetical protein
MALIAKVLPNYMMGELPWEEEELKGEAWPYNLSQYK